MGWTYRHKPASVSAKDEIIEELSCDNDAARWVVLAISMKGGVAYAATELIRKFKNGKLNMKTRKVFATVVLTGYARNDYYNFGTKVIDESMGPCECECPVKILDLLTPTEREYELDWRAACRANAAKPKAPTLVEGDVIKFKDPLSFGSNGNVNELILYDAKKRHYRASFGLCRLRRDTLKHRSYKVYRGKKLLMAVNA